MVSTIKDNPHPAGSRIVDALLQLEKALATNYQLRHSDFIISQIQDRASSFEPSIQIGYTGQKSFTLDVLAVTAQLAFLMNQTLNKLSFGEGDTRFDFEQKPNTTESGKGFSSEFIGLLMVVIVTNKEPSKHELALLALTGQESLQISLLPTNLDDALPAALKAVFVQFALNNFPTLSYLTQHNNTNVPNPIDKNFRPSISREFLESNIISQTIRRLLVEPITLLEKYFLEDTPDWSMWEYVEQASQDVYNFCELNQVDLKKENSESWGVSMYTPEKYSFQIARSFWSVLQAIKAANGSQHISIPSSLPVPLGKLIDLNELERNVVLSNW